MSILEFYGPAERRSTSRTYTIMYPSMLRHHTMPPECRNHFDYVTGEGMVMNGGSRPAG
jgi:hypothetical protein